MKIIDLSQNIFSGMKVYPGDPNVEIKEIHSIKKQGWRLRQFIFGSHTGTHVDAFSHMDVKGKSLDKIPLKKFFGPARVVSIDGKFPFKIGLMFPSGKLNLSLLDKILKAKAPFIACSVKCDFSADLEGALLRKGIVTVTDLINVEKLPKGETFSFYGFPLKIKDGDGSPIRAVAIID